MNLNAIYFLLRLVSAEATEAADPAVAGCTSNQGWTVIVMYAVIIAICYFLLIRPQKKRRQQEEQLRKSVEVGDEITTIGGICGRIVSIKDDETLVIESGADRNKIKIKNWAVSSNDTARDRQAADASANEKKGFLANLFNKKSNKSDAEK